MDTIKKIDIHAHATAFPQYAAPNVDGYRMVCAEEIFTFYDKLNVEKGVLLPILSPEATSLPMSNENCIHIASKHPDRFVWFCNVDPRAIHNDPKTDLGFLLDHYKKLGARGVGELTSNLYADDPKMDNLFYHCAKAKLPVTIHIAPEPSGFYGIVDDLGLPRLEKMLKKHPDLIILGHSQPFWAEIGECWDEIRNTYPAGKVKEGRLPKLLREYGNLRCDLSAGSAANALMRDRDYAARFIEEFADRMYYGCDICATKNTFPYDFDSFLSDMREKGEISEENYRKIVRDNAIALLGL
ncbi:MAG: amidohydrolase family protein [Clostridia bacterium]|nr:amidohydrolase family protein [Clostridia bacterium]MBQ9798298.1 amidohydrolase family protein [Clostridia bacterium]